VKDSGRLLWLSVGILLGAAGIALFFGAGTHEVQAANDRYEDYVLCTGSVAVNPKAPTDGVWLLDYKSGKLMGTVIDRNAGKIVGWAEVDLVAEFDILPGRNCHFLMTAGQITQGQAALYVAETSTGKFGVYTMGARPDNQPGVSIRRHDMVLFHQAVAKNNKEKDTAKDK
jgi:hypothetical protein